MRSRARVSSELTLERWKAAMLGGDFAAAWRLSDDYLASEEVRSTPPGVNGSPLWRGQSLRGRRILIHCHHGLGDTVQFIRFMPSLRHIASNVTVLSPPALVPVFATVPGVDHVLTSGTGVDESAYDVQIEIMELAHALRADAGVIGGAVPYLLPQLSHSTRGSSPPQNVGLVWRAGEWCTGRSVPIELLLALAGLRHIRLYSLQRGPARADASTIPAVDVSTDDVISAAKTLCRLDLLISVDTFPAHLAGALGVPVWLLLQQRCDWRWAQRGNTSVWYPTIKIVQQRHQDDWQPVIDTIVAGLTRTSSDMRVA